MQNPLLLIQQFLQSGQFDRAVKASKKLFKDQAHGLSAHRLCAHAYLNLKNAKDALMVLRKACQKWPKDVAVRQDYAFTLFQNKKFGDAKKQYQTLLKFKPDDAIFLANIANCCLFLGELDQAEEWGLKSINVPSPHINGFNVLAGIYQKKDDVDKAAAIYEQALQQCQPGLDFAFNVLQFCEMHNMAEKAQDIYDSLPEAIKNHGKIKLQLAILKRRNKQFDLAERHLLDILDKPSELNPMQEKLCYFELGKVQDHLKKFDLAFDSFTHANALAQQACRDQSYASPYHTMDKIEQLHITGENVERCPHFVLGFPRSGTTLIEQVLNLEESQQTFEETPVIAQLINDAFTLEASGEAIDRTPLQKRYFDLYRQDHGWGGACQIIDRSAPNLIYIQFIRKLFPGAKIVLLLRHPLDILLSCYMQNFTPSGINNQFMDLQKTAQLYDTIYNRIYENNLLDAQNVCVITYENLVRDFTAETQRLFDFFNLTWTENVSDFWQKSRQKKAIKTASYQQVVEPLYDRAVYRWQSYQDQLSPYFDLMDKHLEKQGYAS